MQIILRLSHFSQFPKYIGRFNSEINILYSVPKLLVIESPYHIFRILCWNLEGRLFKKRTAIE
jgi:hypothetical protein